MKNADTSKLAALRTAIDDGEASGQPVETDTETFLKQIREVRLKALQTELAISEQSGMIEGPIDLDETNAKIDQALQTDQLNMPD